MGFRQIHIREFKTNRTEVGNIKLVSLEELPRLSGACPNNEDWNTNPAPIVGVYFATPLCDFPHIVIVFLSFPRNK